jgi:hypothetical protein
LVNKSTADRALVIAAILILLIAAGALFFDNWMWGGRSKRDQSIGFISARRGDVRFRFEDDLKWEKAARGQDLMYNDAIFAGPDSRAELAVGEGQITVNENTMVVIRREDTSNFLKLRFGSIFGELAKNEKMIVETGDGKKIEFQAKSKVRLVVKKTTKATEIEVVEGTGTLTNDGKTTEVEDATRVSVNDKIPTVVEKIQLKILQPLRGETIYSPKPYRYEFAWQWQDHHPAKPNELFTIEFSNSVNFEKVSAVKKVKAKMATSLLASQTTHLYFRVRGPSDELTSVEAVDFVLSTAPEILKPAPLSQWIADHGERGHVPFVFNPVEPERNLWWQVSQDPEFKEILVNVDSQKLEFEKDLVPGQYFVRARTDYGKNNYGPWTKPNPFVVSERVRAQDMPVLTKKVLIPNRDYPGALYTASVSHIQKFLQKQGFLETYFDELNENFDSLQMILKKPENKTLKVEGKGWPAPLMYPGTYIYNVQMEKSGFIASDRSADSQLEIEMAPPRVNIDPTFGDDKEGMGLVKAPFTPILFADSYEIELSSDPMFSNPRSLRTRNPVMVTRVPVRETTFWHVRALAKDGHAISDYSDASVIQYDTSVPAFLAVNGRDPASEVSVMKPEDLVDDRYIRTTFWGWLGFGYNFTDYRQSVPGRGTLQYNDVVGGSRYMEAGFSRKGIGGVLTVKETPGRIRISDTRSGNAVPLDDDSYTWSHYSIEAQIRKRTPVILFSRPVIVGFRVGLQHHQMPFIFLNQAQTLEQKTMNMESASAGALVQWSRANWNYYWLFRYQFPVQSDAGGSSTFSIDPIFAFDGSIGLAYDITRTIKAGAFWYGQWHQFHFNYSDGKQDNSGFQSLFYSTFDLRLGFQF